MKKIKIKNFRIFDAEGVTFEMAPLTILTGCNSSGKSSFTKLWMLLQEFFQQLSTSIQKEQFEAICDYNINFTHGNHKLGYFESVVNWLSESKYITIEYEVDVFSIGRCMQVSITFAPGQLKVDNNGIFNPLGGDDIYVHKSTLLGKSLFAYIHSINISDPQKGLFYEYKIVDNKAVSLFHIDEYYRELLVDMSCSLDFKNAIDEIIACANASEAGVFHPSDYSETDLDDLIKTFDETELNQIHHRWELFKQKFPNIYKTLMKKHGFKQVTRNISHKIDWGKVTHSYQFDNYHFFYPMKFMSELDVLAKEDIMNWVNTNIIEKSHGEWFDCDNYRNRIYHIFSSFIQSDFSKFSDFWSYYEIAYLRDTNATFALHNKCDIYSNIFFGTAHEYHAPFGDNPFEIEFNWEGVSNSMFFEEMLLCLNGFGGYSDFSMEGGPSIEYREYDILIKCAEVTCLEALASATDICNAQFVEIDRSNAQRIYTFDSQGTTFNAILERYIETPQEFSITRIDSNNVRGGFQNKLYKKGTFIKKWLKTLVGYEDITFELAPEGVGVYVYLVKRVNGKKRILSLADVGYGTTPLLSMLIRIELMIGKYMQEGSGKGVLFIEEPESNLHPNLQAELAEMFADVITNYPIKFVLETHSEYLIRKLQILVAKKQASSNDVSIHYLSNPDAKQREENEPQVKQIKIKENGGLTAKFGKGFFDEAIMLSTELLKK